MPKPQLSPVPTNLTSFIQLGDEQVTFEIPYQLSIWLTTLFNRVGEGPLPIQGFLKDSLPPADENGSTGTDVFSSLIFVSDATGGAVVAFSDGVDWRRTTDNSIVD